MGVCVCGGVGVGGEPRAAVQNPGGVHGGIQASGGERRPERSLHGMTKASWTLSGQGL